NHTGRGIIKLPDVVDGEAMPFNQPQRQIVIVIGVADSGVFDKYEQDQAHQQRAQTDQQQWEIASHEPILYASARRAIIALPCRAAIESIKRGVSPESARRSRSGKANPRG